MDVAILVDGCRPIGAQARRITEPELRLVSTSGTLEGEVLLELVCQDLEDLQDYCQPHAPGRTPTIWSEAAVGAEPHPKRPEMGFSCSTPGMAEHM